MTSTLRMGAVGRRTFLFSGLSALTLGQGRAEEDCRMVRHASLDMIPFGGLVVVENYIGDKPIHMLVNTAGYMTAFSESMAQKFGLNIETEPESGIIMYGGRGLRHFVRASDFRIGRMKAPPLKYPLLPQDTLPEGVDGVLAPDFLANFDLDFDFAGGKVNLFSKDHCPGRVGYWVDGRLSPIPLLRDDDDPHIFTHITLEGSDIKAMINTGSSRSLMSLETAYWRFGVKKDDPRLIDDHHFSNLSGAKQFPFKQLSFGNVKVENPEITLVPDSSSQMGPNSPDFILGLGVLRHLHVYIAYREKNLYITEAGAHR